MKPRSRCRNRLDSGSRLESFLLPSPMTYGRCPNTGTHGARRRCSSSARYSTTCRGVEDSRSSPRSTCVMPMSASSTGLTSVYSGWPLARTMTKSGTEPGLERDLAADQVGERDVRRRASAGAAPARGPRRGTRPSARRSGRGRSRRSRASGRGRRRGGAPRSPRASRTTRRRSPPSSSRRDDVGVQVHAAATAGTARAGRRPRRPRPSPGRASAARRAAAGSSPRESRAASVSSMRKTNVPPTCRAYAQLNSAVRIRPTCGVPVGEGQKRTRTAEPGAAAARGGHGAPGLAGARRPRQPARAQSRRSTGLRSTPMSSTSTSTMSPVHDRPDARGGAGEDDVAGQQREHLGDVRDQVRRRRRSSATCGRPGVVSPLTRARTARSSTSSPGTIHGPIGHERVEALGAGPLRVGALDVARGDVVGDGVAEDWSSARSGGTSLVTLPMTTASSASWSTSLGPVGQHDRVVGADHRGVRLEEQQRRGRAARCPSPRRGRRSCGRRR